MSVLLSSHNDSWRWNLMLTLLVLVCKSTSQWTTSNHPWMPLAVCLWLEPRSSTSSGPAAVHILVHGDQALHYDHLPDIVFAPLLLPKQPKPVEAWTPVDPWRCAVVSGTKVLAADPLRTVSCEEEAPWIRLVCPTYPTDVRSDWDLGNLDANSIPRAWHYASQTILEPFLLSGMVHYPAEWVHSNQGIQFPWNMIHLTRPSSSFAPCSSSDDHMPIVGAFSGGQGQAYVPWNLSIRTSINYFSKLSTSSSSVGSDMGQPSLPMCINEPWPPMTLQLAHHCSLVGPLLINTDRCRPGPPHKNCSFENADYLRNNTSLSP